MNPAVKSPATKYRIVTIENIIDAVSRHSAVPTHEIMGKSRKPHVVQARHVAMTIAYRTGRWSYETIADAFGVGNHSSVRHAVKKIERIISPMHLNRMRDRAYTLFCSAANELFGNAEMEMRMEVESAVTENFMSEPRTTESIAQERIALANRKRELEDELKDVGKQIDKVSKELRQRMTDAGIDKMTINGQTCYVDRTLWAGAPKVFDANGKEVSDKDTLIEAMKLCGMDDMVKENVDMRTLSAWLRNQPTDDETMMPKLPEELDGVVQVREVYTVKVRGSKK